MQVSRLCAFERLTVGTEHDDGAFARLAETCFAAALLLATTTALSLQRLTVGAERGSSAFGRLGTVLAITFTASVVTSRVCVCIGMRICIRVRVVRVSVSFNGRRRSG